MYVLEMSRIEALLPFMYKEDLLLNIKTGSNKFLFLAANVWCFKVVLPDKN